MWSIVFAAVVLVGCAHTAPTATPAPTPHVRAFPGFRPPEEYRYILEVPAPRECTADERPTDEGECTFIGSTSKLQFTGGTLYGAQLEGMTLTIHGNSKFVVRVDGIEIESEFPTGWVGDQQREEGNSHETVQVQGHNGMHIELIAEVLDEPPQVNLAISFAYGHGPLNGPASNVYVQ